MPDSLDAGQGFQSRNSGCSFCISKNPKLKLFIEEITNESTIHGIKYLGSRKTRPVEKLLWTIVTFSCFLGGVYLVLRLYDKFKTSPIIISLQPQETLISQIPFPAITICNVNMLKRSLLSKFYDDLVVELLYAQQHGQAPRDIPELVRKVAKMDFLSQFCLSAKSFRRFVNATMEDAEGRLDFMQNINDLLEDEPDENYKRLENLRKNKEWRTEQAELYSNVTISCHEMLLICSWAGDIIPCKELFFSIQTQHGRCCVFNMMPKALLLKNMSKNDTQRVLKNIPPETVREWENFINDDLIIKDMDKVSKIKFPKHQKSGGKPYGLTILTNPHLNEYSTCNTNDGEGYLMVAHSPISSPSVIDYGAGIPVRTEVFVDVEPRIAVADDEKLQNIHYEKRGCYLFGENIVELTHYQYYSIENCQSECIAEHTYKNCSCVRFFMPRNSTQDICGAKQRECTQQILNNLAKYTGRDSPCGHCLPPCTEIQYKLQISHFDLREHHLSSYFSYKDQSGQMSNATDYSIIHIFMGTDSVYAKERTALYTNFDLIANAGGLLGLTLGISIISIIEIIYFCTLRAWFQLRSIWKERRSQDTKILMVKSKRKSNTGRNSVTEWSKTIDELGYYNWSVVGNRFAARKGSKAIKTKY